MKVRLAPRARADLRAIREHYLDYSPTTADNVRQAIVHAINLVAARPDIGIRNRVMPDVFSKLVSRYPFRVHYRLRGDVLEVVHIRHTSRRAWHQVPK